MFKNGVMRHFQVAQRLVDESLNLGFAFSMGVMLPIKVGINP
jgi:hypothetical protein